MHENGHSPRSRRFLPGLSRRATSTDSTRLPGWRHAVGTCPPETYPEKLIGLCHQLVRFRGRRSTIPRGRPAGRFRSLVAGRKSRPGSRVSASAIATKVTTRMFTAPRSISPMKREVRSAFSANNDWVHSRRRRSSRTFAAIELSSRRAASTFISPTWRLAQR